MKHKSNFDIIENLVLLNGFHTKVSGSYNTISKYLEVRDSKTDKEVKIRFSNHAQVYDADYSVDGIEGTLDRCIEFLENYFEKTLSVKRKPKGSYRKTSRIDNWTYLYTPDKRNYTVKILTDEKGKALIENHRVVSIKVYDDGSYERIL